MRQLCQEQTNLDKADIDWLIRHADSLMLNLNYDNEDVFIDVQNVYSGDAVVIFHKKPLTKASLYEKPVVGGVASVENEPGVHRTLHTGVPTIGLSAISQEGVRIQQTVFPICRDNRVLGTLILERDADDKTASSMFLKDNLLENYEMTPSADEDVSAKEFSFLEHMDDAILVFDYSGKLSYFNEIAAETYRMKFGYIDPLNDLHYDNLVLGNMLFKDIKRRWSVHQKRHYFSIAEFQYGAYYFSVKQYIIPETQSVVVVCKDISEHKQREAQLLITETVLREMNHRIKNNLQTVVSLMRLQAEKSSSAEVKKSLYDSLNRILSIAMTHELLSNQGDEKVAVEDLLRGIMTNMQRCFQGQLTTNFTCRLSEDLYLDSNRATALALIVNELVQNSYDHAFKDGQQNNPKIDLQIKEENAIISVKVSDNGNGYPTEATFDNHLGLMIVERFVKSKLSGKLLVHSDSKGTVTTIRFKQ